MPTAVERFFDSFLKLSGFDRRQEQAALNDAFLKIDGDFLKLSDANADNFVKIEHKVDHEFDVIGGAFIKLGEDFGKIAFAGALVDDFVLKVTQATTTEVPTAAADVAPGPQSDFIKWDQAMKVSGSDLKILGADFLKLNDSRNFDVFQLKIKGLTDDLLKLGNDMTANGDTFHKLGVDIAQLGNVDNPSPLDLAYKELGGELQKVGMVFGALSADFLDLLPAVQVGGGGGAGNIAASSDIKLSLATAFLQLNQDFIKLDSALGGVGEGAAAVIGNLFSHSSGGGGGAG
jgi:hypothetical protein